MFELLLLLLFTFLCPWGSTVPQMRRGYRLPFVSFVVAVATPLQVVAAQDGRRVRAVVLDVSVQRQFDEAQVIEDALRVRTARHLARRGVEVRGRAMARLAVNVVPQDKSSVDFVVSVVLTQGADTLGREENICQLCGAVEIFDSVAMGIEALVESIPAETTETPAELRLEPSPAKTPKPLLGPLGWSGTAAVGLGAVSVAAGAYYWAKGEDVRSTPDAALLEVRDFRPMGRTLVAVGCVMMLGGVTMVVVDALRRKRRTLAFAPSIGPGIVGGRF